MIDTYEDRIYKHGFNMADLSKVMCGLTIRPRCPLRRFRGDWHVRADPQHQP